MEFVRMKPQHISQVAALEKECFSAPWSENSITSELNNPIALWLVALEEGTVAGYVGSQFGYGEADMMNIAVAAQYRRHGVGMQLVEALIDSLKKMDVHSLTLEVRQSNNAAISLYKKMGFSQVGIRPNYYVKPREAALILRKEW